MSDASRQTRVLKKSLASVVVAGVLGMQAAEVVSPHDGRWWPFVDYPMYSQAVGPGATSRMLELRAIPCHRGSPARRVTPYEIGYKEFRLVGSLRGIARADRTASADRDALSRVTAAHVVPAPCILEIWERAVTTTAHGVEPEQFRRPAWNRLASWEVAGPGSVNE